MKGSEQKNRRSYSKGGCRECKRRKIKCDEGKPFCNKCVRLDKVCSYPNPGETVLRISNKSLQSRGESLLSIRQYQPEPCCPKKTPPADQLLSNLSINKLLNTSSMDYEMDMLGEQLYDFEDLDLVASDLNGIVLDLFTITPNEKTEILFNDNANRSQLDDTEKTGLPIDFIDLSPTEFRYFQHYYNVFALQMTPFGRYDENLKIYTYPLRDIYVYHAAVEPILKAAILGNGARYYYQRDHLEQDKIAYNSYLSTCLSLLANELSKRNEKELTSNIEAVVLTVIFLSAANAVTAAQEWRLHLQGAKHLILKNSNFEPGSSSKTLIICKFYMYAFDVLAGISSKFGGTMNDEELDKMDKFTGYEMQVLKKSGIILDNGFNTVTGSHIDSWGVCKEYVKLINRLRIDGDNFQPNDPLRYLEVLSLLQQQMDIVFHDKNVYLSQYPDSLQLVDKVGDRIVSLMDACQQAYPLASVLTIYKRIFNLPFNDPQIQVLVDRILYLVDWVHEKQIDQNGFDPLQFSIAMFQWPVLIAGENSIKVSQRKTVTRFFQLSSEIGSGTAEVAINHLENIWIKRDAGQELGSEDDVKLDMISF